jgi:hypothetical protein
LKLNPGQIATLVANLGVVAGIVFLAVELRQNNELLRAEADFNYLQNRINNRQDVITDPEYAALWVRIENNDSLTADEQLRLDYHIEATILAWQWEYGQLSDGNLREDGDATAARYRTGINSGNGFANRFPHVWSYFQPQLSDDFVVWMSENVLR